MLSNESLKIIAENGEVHSISDGMELARRLLLSEIQLAELIKAGNKIYQISDNALTCMNEPDKLFISLHDIRRLATKSR